MIVVYSKPQCVACDQTKKWLTREGLPYEEEQLADHPDLVAEVKASGFSAAPVCVTDQGYWWAGLSLDKLRGYKANELFKEETRGGLDSPASIS